MQDFRQPASTFQSAAASASANPYDHKTPRNRLLPGQYQPDFFGYLRLIDDSHHHHHHRLGLRHLHRLDGVHPFENWACPRSCETCSTSPLDCPLVHD
eukprot:4927864-Amphidinium_carterae.1